MKAPLWYFLLIGLGGCVPAALVVGGAGAGAGTYAYVEGTATAVYPAPFETVWVETQALLEQENIGIIEKSRQEGKGTIKGKTVDNRDVTVDLAVRGTRSTRVNIRVGLVPDEDAAERLQRALARRVDVRWRFSMPQWPRITSAKTSAGGRLCYR